MKGYRTIAINVLTVVAAIAALPEVTGLLPPESIPFLLAGQAAINIIMRFLTTTPVGKPE